MWQMKAENNKLVEKHTECKCFHTGLEGMLWWEWKMMRVTCSSVTNPTEHLWGDFGAPCQTDSVLHPSKTLNEGISFGRMLFVPSEEFYTLENRPRKAAGGKTSLLWLGFKFGFQICHVYWGSTSLLKRSVHTDSDIYDCSKVWATSKCLIFVNVVNDYCIKCDFYWNIYMGVQRPIVSNHHSCVPVACCVS